MSAATERPFLLSRNRRLPAIRDQLLKTETAIKQVTNLNFCVSFIEQRGSDVRDNDTTKPAAKCYIDGQLDG